MLVASAPARVVITASTGHYPGTMDFDDLGFEKGYTIMRAYSRSKLANVLHARTWPPSSPAPASRSTRCTPARWRPTSGPARRGSRDRCSPSTKRWMRSPAEGGADITYLAIDPAVEGETGGYYDDDRLKEPSELARDDGSAPGCARSARDGGARMTAAVLVLEDGRTFRGEAYGAEGETFGEAVFNTGMTGYQETLTDPSYHRQVVVMTAPHIGNTGINDEDPESRRIWVAGYVVRDPARVPCSWRSRRSLDDELREQGVVGISGIDTRALTRHLRERGAMRVGISSTETDPPTLLERVLAAAPRWPAPSWPARSPPSETYVVPAVGRAAVHRRRARPRHQGEDPAPDGRARHRGARAARDRDPRRRARGRAGRAVLLQRPRRPGRDRPARSSCCRARWSAGCPTSGSASATSCSAGRSGSAPTS